MAEIVNRSFFDNGGVLVVSTSKIVIVEGQAICLLDGAVHDRGRDERAATAPLAVS